MSQSRQLAAIMFTDIVGYTALMDENEQKAFDLLKKNRRIQRPIIEMHNGRWLKEIGDGVLASFSTVTDAVTCAIEIQQTCQKETDLKLRIGIHLGEVVFEGNDVFGSGVNIASRLEPMAPVGGILVSGAVYKNIHNKKEIQATLLEERELRGVREPVKIYQVQHETLDQQFTPPDKAEAPIEHKLKKARKPAMVVASLILLVLMAISLWYFKSDSTQAKESIEILDKSIAIIPFKDISPHGDQQWFSDGIMDAILSNLSQVGELRVISRTSMEQFRESPKSIPEIAREINVAHVLEGSVQRIDDKVRIIVQLINANKDEHIWSKTYDKEITEVFDIQAEIAEQIAEELQIRINPGDLEIIKRGPTEILSAYDLYLRGLQYDNDFYIRKDEQDLRLAIHFYSRALELDKKFLLAKVNLAHTFIQRANIRGEGVHLYDSAMNMANEMLAQHPDKPEVLALLANIYRFKGVNKIEAKKTLLKAVMLNPNNPNTLLSLAEYYEFEETRYDLAMVLVDRALSLEPTNPRHYAELGWHWLNLHNPEKAESLFLDALAIQSNYSSAIIGLSVGVLIEFKNNFSEGLSLLREGLLYNPDALDMNHQIAQQYSWYGDFMESERHFNNVKEVIENEEYTITRRTPWFPHRYAYTLWNLDKKEEAMEYFQKHIDRDMKFLKDSIQTFGFFSYYDLAAVNAFLGNKDQAYYWLDQILENNSWARATHILKDPLFDSIKEEDEFQRFLNAYNDRINRQRRHYELIKELPFNEYLKRIDEPLPVYMDIRD